MHWGFWIAVGVWVAGILSFVLALTALACTRMARDEGENTDPGQRPDPEDDVEVPNPVDLRAWGGRRSGRARGLEAERRARFPEP